MLHVEVGGASLVLLAERAAYLPAQRALLVADVHVGKAASFRGLGVPVPGGTTGGTLARLSTALAASGATRLIVLGDFVHSACSYARSTLEA
ncbi:MAG TPA: DEAD/DEAH box helicase, partial [Burkholderiaceae bacterium]|nr:DEAD/DEAH box helicase [Burkholderiaceae bacterium]